MRKLATIRKIKDLLPIIGADRIELAIVDSWKVVVSKGLKIGDTVCYCEIDSFLPIKPEFEFLRKSCYRKMADGQEGFRLKTIRLKNTLSQGLCIPIDELPQLSNSQVGDDVSDILGIVKWDPPIPAELTGRYKGNFPSFLKKTDQERVQNLTNEYQEYLASGINFYATEKLDGCLDGKTIVETENGNMSIRDICESKYKGGVKSFNTETGNIEFQKVKNTFINKPTIHQWFKIKLENGIEIKLTGNHRVWIPDLFCWRRVDELRGDEIFLLKN
jgi:hypothetical protein